MDDLKSFPSVRLGDYRSSSISKRAFLSHDGRYLFSTIYLGKSDSSGDVLVTLRKISDCDSRADTVEIQHQKLLPYFHDDIYFGTLFFVDESYIIWSIPEAIIISGILQPAIEVYSNDKAETKICCIPSAVLLDYSNGYLVVHVADSIR